MGALSNFIDRVATEFKSVYTELSGHNHSGVYEPAKGTDDNYVTDAEKLALHSHSNKSALDNVSGTNTGNETTTTVGALINGATAKTTPVDADMVGLMDSAGSNVLKKLSWANIKTALNSIYAALSHTHGNVTNDGKIGSTANLPVILGTAGALQASSFGTGANTFCQGNDSRLSDARTPASHVHGNITNDGKIGSTADLPVKTSTAGAVAAGAWGTGAGTFCQGNDSRLSDVRTPTDSSVTYTKIAAALTQRATDNDGTWDFAANGIVDAAFSSGATTVAFTNLQLNKCLKVKLVITNAATFTLPAICKLMAGSASASGVNGTYYIYFDCWKSTATEEIITTIMKV